MAEIYANSDCNISATGVASGEAGMFTPAVKPAFAKVPLASEHVKCVVYEPRGVRRQDPLSSRGWVFQEHALVRFICEPGIRDYLPTSN